MKDQGDKPEDVVAREALKIENYLIRKRLQDREVEKIRSMSLQELLDQRRVKEKPQPPSPTVRHYLKDIEMQLKQSGVEGDLEEIAKKHLQMMAEAEQQNKIIRK